MVVFGVGSGIGVDPVGNGGRRVDWSGCDSADGGQQKGRYGGDFLQAGGDLACAEPENSVVQRCLP
ncbi:hypothetical protein GOP47_0016462 [Adiantum capillus-veneris]|uniref:Uncharacterized protein n=1 Tax=Adiantum capillus-veneris TaxID=13818 RepID=A0A9D4UI46_ADICA|nr:hypothetical protein GOP47_0016462 [Adiantum capillus-veneris]